MKKVHNQADLKKALREAKAGEEILFYERPMETQEERLEFHKYLYGLVTMAKINGMKIMGVISFKKKNLKGGLKNE